MWVMVELQGGKAPKSLCQQLGTAAHHQALYCTTGGLGVTAVSLTPWEKS